VEGKYGGAGKFAKLSTSKQLALAFGAIGLVSAVCFACSGFLGYRVVAFILLLVLSVIASFFDIIPVLLTAALSALIWDFFFIPPRFALHVTTAEDSFLLLTYFVIALVNTALTYKIRRIEKESMEKEERAHTLKLYNTMLNSLSHELRTPIAAIIGATDNLQHNSSHLSEHNRRELVGEIAKASFRLNRQVDNLLNMSRLESGFLAPKPDWCDITELVYEEVKRIEEAGAMQCISIHINPSIPLFRLDKGMLEQVIGNLLNNAVNYTTEHSQVSIAASADADVLQLIIEDNGAGFPEEEIKHVFDKFYRLKNSKAGGTGLGLSIARGFTEALGGSITLANRSEGGARFTIRIKAETSHPNNLKNE
jgi:two-component system sensor histidine kinase KdpD